MADVDLPTPQKKKKPTTNLIENTIRLEKKKGKKGKYNVQSESILKLHHVFNPDCSKPTHVIMLLGKI